MSTNYNFDDIYNDGTSTDNPAFLSDYGNEKFVSNKFRKATIDYSPQLDQSDEIVAGVEYVVGYIPANAIITSLGTVVEVGAVPETAAISVKLGGVELHTAATETAEYTVATIATADAHNPDFRRLTVSFDGIVTSDAGKLTVVYEFLDYNVFEGPFGS